MIALAAAALVTLNVGGLERSYEVHLPNGRAPGEPAALVIVFHGGGGNARNAARMTGMDAKADREGFIAVYANGTGPRGDRLLTWNTWRCCGSAFDRKVDDVGFVRALVEDVAKRYPVDRKRIYATGLSNGGMMAYRVGCELSDVVAAIAPVAGALNSYDCRTPHPVSVIAFHGTADQHILFDGGMPKVSFDSHKRADNSVQFAIEQWRKNDRCEGEPVRRHSGNIWHTAYACPGGVAVELYAVEGQGHAWPAIATDLMWDFFAKHPKP